MTAERSVPANAALNETVWAVARPPYGQYDFVALRRITAGAGGQSAGDRPVFLFLPGPHQHGEIILTDERYDLRLYLAKRGVETWTLDYRTHFVPREQIYDSNFMQAWTVEAFVEDVTAAAHFVREISGTQKIFVGGFGYGATFAALYAARNAREDVLGVVLFDGYVLDPPDMEPLYRERAPTPNWFADDLESRYMPYKRWIKILQDVSDDPSGPDFLPIPLFDNRGEALAHFLYVNANFGAQGGLSNAKGGYADVTVLARILQQQDRYWPRVQNHGGFDFKRHLAGAQFDYEKGLATMNVPILAFASGNIDKAGVPWAERVAYTARATQTTDVQYRVLENWGHLDVLFGTAAAQEVFLPVSDWIARHNVTTQASK
ncbi:MAG: alpha/beta fold hydrolase [Deltaproteobacteria bacterium]|nr:alpha/beta fold hydrolase [Deltaproteobacteria bacterium]